MPYKREGKTVYVKKEGKWKKLHTHTTERKAQGHVTALRIAKEKRRRHGSADSRTPFKSGRPRLK